jgi:hypothetical protein
LLGQHTQALRLSQLVVLLSALLAHFQRVISERNSACVVGSAFRRIDQNHFLLEGIPHIPFEPGHVTVRFLHLVFEIPEAQSKLSSGRILADNKIESERFVIDDQPPQIVEGDVAQYFFALKLHNLEKQAVIVGNTDILGLHRFELVVENRVEH